MAPKTPGNFNPEGMFQLDLPDPPEPDISDADAAKAAADKEQADKIVALQAQLNELQAHNKDLLQFVTARQGPQPVVNTQDDTIGVPELNLEGLPDAVVDPQGFRKQLSDRVRAAVGQAAAKTAEVVTRQSDAAMRSQNARNDAKMIMNRDYPDIGKQEALVALAATQYMGDLNKRGVNIDQALISDTKGFVDAVAERAQKILSDIKGTKGEEDTGEEDDADDGRGMNMLAPSNNRGHKALPKKEQQGDFVKEIRKMQAEAKIY